MTREELYKWLRRAAPLLIWLTLALLSTTQLYSIFRLENRAAPLWRIACWQSSAWLLWALLTPGVLWLGRRYRLERANWRRVALIHLSASVSFAALHLVLQALSRYWTPLSLEPRLTLQ
jgi:two-component system, LytTR family, sensor kinase